MLADITYLPSQPGGARPIAGRAEHHWPPSLPCPHPGLHRLRSRRGREPDLPL